MQTRICDNCGEEAELWTMRDMNIGRKTLWLCPRCYGSGAHAAKIYTIKLHQKRRKEEDK